MARIDVPSVIYKFMPAKYVPAFLQDGDILFRNLAYFRTCEDRARGDAAEGLHVDAPDNQVTLSSLSAKIHRSGAYRFLNSIDQVAAFAFCTSTRFDTRLFSAFQSDACVVIREPDKFIRRCQAALRLLPGKHVFLARHVAYYDLNAATEENIKDGQTVPFLKDTFFESQSEYRIAFGKVAAFNLVQRIVQPGYDLAEEAASQPHASRVLRIGPLDRIAEVRYEGPNRP